MSDPSACISRCRGDDHTQIPLNERMSETERREEKLLMLLLAGCCCCLLKGPRWTRRAAH